MPSATQQKKDTHLQGYTQVMELEKKEEERVQKALAVIAHEEEKTKAEWEEKVKAAEAQARAEANEELKQYKDTELARIIAEGEKHTAEERKHIESSHKKNVSAVVKTLTETVLDPSFLTR